MKRFSGLMFLGMTSLSLLMGCGGSGANTGTEGERIEMLRPFAGEALINSTNQPVKWSGGDADTNVDIVFVMDVSTSMYVLLQKLEDEILTVDAKLKSLDVLPDVNYGLVVFVDDVPRAPNGKADYPAARTLAQP